jgi:ELWxxDGT repeat protein
VLHRIANSLLVFLLLGLSAIPGKVSNGRLPYLVKNITPASFDPWTQHHPVGIFSGTQHLYFVPDEMYSSDYGVWISDGTETGTYKIPNGSLCRDITDWGNADRPLEWAVAIHDVLYYSGEYCELYRTDGTLAGTRQVSPSLSLYRSPDHLVNFNDSILYVVQVADLYNSSYRPYQLWISDGTSDGTHTVKELGEDILSDLQISPIKVTGSFAYFFTYLDRYVAGGNLYQLWRCDGTPAGTEVIAEFIQPVGYWTPEIVVGPNNLIFFSAPLTSNNIYQMVTWQSDGTPQGTQPVDLINNVPNEYAIPNYYLLAGNILYIMQIKPTSLNIYTTQGKNFGGISELVNFPLHSSLEYLYFSFSGFENHLFFTFYHQLWETEGTPESTALVAQFVVGGYSQPDNLFGVGGHLFLSATDPETGSELWAIDGPGKNPQMVMDINPGPSSSSPSHFNWAGGKLFFYALDENDGRELWAYDYLTEKLFLPVIK